MLNKPENFDCKALTEFNFGTYKVAIQYTTTHSSWVFVDLTHLNLVQTKQIQVKEQIRNLCLAEKFIDFIRLYGKTMDEKSINSYYNTLVV